MGLKKSKFFMAKNNPSIIRRTLNIAIGATAEISPSEIEGFQVPNVPLVSPVAATVLMSRPSARSFIPAAE